MLAAFTGTNGFLLLVEAATLLEGPVPLPHQSQPTWRLKDSVNLPLAASIVGAYCMLLIRCMDGWMGGRVDRQLDRVDRVGRVDR